MRVGREKVALDLAVGDDAPVANGAKPLEPAVGGDGLLEESSVFRAGNDESRERE